MARFTPTIEDSTVQLIAIHLPQFHPVPENDFWWGKGFTEWTNVVRAGPLFRGHYQPRLPADLGFYDLRVDEAREAQAELARQYGIGGFCFYHYWFGGHKLLERPVEATLATGRPDFPFCLCWVNESWTRSWLYDHKWILIKQEYSPQDDVNHARYLCPFFADSRYLRVRGRPVFIVYRPQKLPSSRATFDRFRTEAVRAGLPEPWIVGADGWCPGTDCRVFGCDATLRFQPMLGVLRWRRACGEWCPKSFCQNLRHGIISGTLRVIDDALARQRMAELPLPPLTYPCCYVSWDNTPRRGRGGIVFLNNSPETFQTGLRQAIESATKLPADQRFVFINAWNEWAEGNHLEPDQKHGHAYLQAVRNALLESGVEANERAAVAQSQAA
jgi:lipopolysaccharide biosynthesis protein